MSFEKWLKAFECVYLKSGSKRPNIEKVVEAVKYLFKNKLE